MVWKCRFLYNMLECKHVKAFPALCYSTPDLRRSLQRDTQIREHWAIWIRLKSQHAEWKLCMFVSTSQRAAYCCREACLDWTDSCNTLLSNISKEVEAPLVVWINFITWPTHFGLWPLSGSVKYFMQPLIDLGTDDNKNKSQNLSIAPQRLKSY